MAKLNQKNTKLNSGVKWLMLISIFITVVGVSLGQLGRLNSYLSFGIYLHDLGISLGLFTLGLNLYLTQESHSFVFIKSRLTVRWQLVAAWLILSVTLACLKSNSWLPLLYSLRFFSYGLVLYQFYQLWSLPTRWRSFSMLLLTLVTLGFGFWQYIFWPDMRFLAALSFDDHLYRLIGTWFDPAVTGGLLTLIGLYWLNRFDQVKKISYRFTVGLLSLIVVITVGLTFSRASYLALILAYVTLALAQWRINKSGRLIIVSLALLFGLGSTIFLVPKPTGEGVNLNRMASVTARVTNEESLIKQLSTKNWLFGQGLFIQTGESSGVNHARLPNNFFVFLLIDFGLVGSLVLAYLILPKLLKVVKNEPLLAATLVGLLTASQFNNLMLHPAIWVTSVLVLSKLSKE